MPKHRTRLFQNGNSQAVRIPKALAYPRADMEMEIERDGDSLIVRPARQRLTGLAGVFRAFGAGFMGEGRDQPELPDRPWPDRGPDRTGPDRTGPDRTGPDRTGNDDDGSRR